jgi:hypothetical protein
VPVATLRPSPSHESNSVGLAAVFTVPSALRDSVVTCQSRSRSQCHGPSPRRRRRVTATFAGRRRPGRPASGPGCRRGRRPAIQAAGETVTFHCRIQRLDSDGENRIAQPESGMARLGPGPLAGRAAARAEPRPVSTVCAGPPVRPGRGGAAAA